MDSETFWGLTQTTWTAIYTLLTAGLPVVAIAAALYAKRQWQSTREQLGETRAAQLEAERPYVVVTIEPGATSRHLFELVVRNIGRRPALAASIRLDPPPVRQESRGHPRTVRGKNAYRANLAHRPRPRAASLLR